MKKSIKTFGQLVANDFVYSLDGAYNIEKHKITSIEKTNNICKVKYDDTYSIVRNDVSKYSEIATTKEELYNIIIESLDDMILNSKIERNKEIINLYLNEDNSNYYNDIIKNYDTDIMDCNLERNKMILIMYENCK